MPPHPLAATLLAGAWLLESLELERSNRVTVDFLPAGDRGKGEPIALRERVGLALSTQGAFGGGVKLTQGEQMAAMRAARQRRQPILGSVRRPDRRAR